MASPPHPDAEAVHIPGDVFSALNETEEWRCVLKSHMEQAQRLHDEVNT